MSNSVHIIGGGLAGAEAAWQAAKYGASVKLYEMKPGKSSPAHSSRDLAELVCSNSFKANNVGSAAGLLKEEMRTMHSLILQCADQCAVPAGGALAVDRTRFSRMITERLEAHPSVSVIRKEITSFRDLELWNGTDPVVIATGPLTSDSFSEFITGFVGRPSLKFYDAAAPVLYKDSVNPEIAFQAARYGKGSDDYLNCPMNREQYETFYEALVSAETAPVHGFEETLLYEGCMPIESMAKRGRDTIRFGPMKPVGLRNPKTGEPNYAVVQLRRDNLEDTLYNMVGFQTRLKFGEQKRVFSLIPGLENCEFARYGVMHRNTYICSPGFLNAGYGVIAESSPIFFAGQITGVEGYIESASSGLVAGINAARAAKGLPSVIFSAGTAIGSLANYVASYGGSDFQPMGANFGIIREPEALEVIKGGRKNRNERRLLVAEAALQEIKKTAGILHV